MEHGKDRMRRKFLIAWLLLIVGSLGLAILPSGPDALALLAMFSGLVIRGKVERELNLRESRGLNVSAKLGSVYMAVSALLLLWWSIEANERFGRVHLFIVLGPPLLLYLFWEKRLVSALWGAGE